LSIPVYEPGRPIEEIKRLYKLRRVIKLASNENSLGPSPKALVAIDKAGKDIHRYPDGGAFYLKNAIARRFNIKPSNIIPGNGTNEILHMINLAFVEKGDEVIFGSPSFVVYEMEGLIQDAKITKVALKDFRYDLKKISSCITGRTRAVFIANPNNPTGTFVTGDEVSDFMQTVPPNVLVVFDEAYAEYAPPEVFPETLKYVRADKNVIVLRTFSKIYGLAGLRIGYGIAKEPIIKAIEHVRQPFNTNTIAQRAALSALKDWGHVKKSFLLNRKGLGYLTGEFERLGLKYVPSGANFILVHIGRSAKGLFKKLLREGVIVRPLGGGLSEYIRVTVGTPEENRFFIKKLEKNLCRP
jgi:histidinol-phosphate aminotransferase